MSAILLLCLLQDAAEAGKIADIKSFTGGVTIAGADGQSREPKKVGRRFRNTSLFDEDRVETQPAAECEVLFPDDSTVTLREKSRIQILQKQLPKANPDGKTIGRRIRLLVGEIVTDVVPNKSIQTDFETPAGTAAVRGTGGTIRVNPATGAVTITVTAGTFHFHNVGGQILFSLQAGQSAQFSVGADGKLSVQALGAAITGQIGNARVRLDGHVEVEVRDGRVRATPLGGNVEFEGEDGVWNPLGNDFEGDIDPAIGDDFDPAADPFFELMFEDPAFAEMLFGDAEFFFPESEFQFDVENIGSDFEANPIDNVRLRESFRALILTSQLIVHVHDDWEYLPFALGESDAPGILSYWPSDDYLHAGVPLTDIVDLELLDGHNEWHLDFDGDPFIPPGRHALFHDDPVDPFGFDDLSADLRLWAAQAQAGIFDNHLFGHVALGIVHHDFHLVNDCEPDDTIYLPEHGEFHGELIALHNTLHAGDLHAFIHGTMNSLHTAWHDNVAAAGSCTPADIVTPGTNCHAAHEHFHEHLNAFHDHLHQAFGVP